MNVHSLLLSALVLLAPAFLFSATSAPKPSESNTKDAESPCVATDGVRPQMALNRGWRFLQQDCPEALKPGFDDREWRLLNLPYDWTIEGTYSPDNPSGGSCGYLPGGIGVYRKNVCFPQTWTANGRRVMLEFAGVFRNSDVYVNGRHMGRRAYGWISFGYDITDALTPDGLAEIAVRVDNAQEPAARWYTGSGIYADVWAESVAPVRIARHGQAVTTPEVTESKATVEIVTELFNETQAPQSATVRVALFGPDGAPIAQGTGTPAPLPADGKAHSQTLRLNVPNPQRWSPETPHLYTLHTTVLQGDVPVDSKTVRFGIRSLRFDAQQGFFLNDVPTKLRGVADHWAVGALGAAVPKNILRNRLLQLKRMGVNAVRTAHNPRPEWFYTACDEIGLMVMDEIFDGWQRKAPHDYGSNAFATDWRKDVTEWVKRDRNHPSIILWSIGNETHERDIHGITPLIHALDGTRPTTGGGVAFGVDVVGVNGPSERADFPQPDPKRPFVATEAPHTWQVRGMYETQTWYRDGLGKRVTVVPNLTPAEIFGYDWIATPRHRRGFQSSYDNAYVRLPARANWAITRDTPWRMGEFRWTGYDYLGEASYVSGGFPYRLFTSGAIDCANFEKDLYYLYQSLWTSPDSAPMAHILPSWTHPTMKLGTEIPVWVYSNCETVELFKDGVSLGKITRGPADRRPWDKMQFEWKVPWAPGTLLAKASRPNGTVVAETSVSTAGVPAKLRLSANEDVLPRDADHVAEITAQITDAAGIPYPYGENRIFFAVTGPADIRALDNGNPIDTERHAFIHHRRAFMGLAKLFLQARDEPGEVLVTAAAILGESRALTSDRVSIDVAHLSLRGTPSVPQTKIFYTLDGSEPNQQRGTPYTGPFHVRQGTTVRALVVANGQPLMELREVFGPEEGLCWKKADDEGDTSKGLSPEVLKKLPSVIVQPACIAKKARIGLTADGQDVRLFATDHLGPYAYWFLAEAPSGGVYLVSHRGHRYLAAKDGEIFLAEHPSEQAEWAVNGDREGFDYIQHRRSGLRLGLSPDGAHLRLLPASYGKDDDFTANRAYWHLRPCPQSTR